jgi:hypothetical protein
MERDGRILDGSDVVAAGGFRPEAPDRPRRSCFASSVALLDCEAFAIGLKESYEPRCADSQRSNGSVILSSDSYEDSFFGGPF